MATAELVNPYEQIWKTRDLSGLDKPIELDNNRSEFSKGLSAFGNEMKATGYGLAALGSQGLENVVGKNPVTSGITDWGIKGYNDSLAANQSQINAPAMPDVSQIKTASDAMDWAGYQLGKGLPMLASLALSGGVGGAVARLGAKEGVAQLAKAAVGDVVKKAVTTDALKAVEGQVVTNEMKSLAAKAIRDRFEAGAITGGFLGSAGLEGGQAFGEDVAAGVKPEDAVKSAIAVGGINGALEFLPFYGAAKSIGLGQYAKRGIADIIKSDAGLAKKAVELAGEIGSRAGKGALVGAGVEGITEGLQELTSIAGLRWAKQDPIFADLTDADWNRITNASMAGALVGGATMGVGATLGGPHATEVNTPPIETAIDPATIQTRKQTLEAKLAEVEAGIKAAQAIKDTKKVAELQQIKDVYDVALQQEDKQAPTGVQPTPENPVDVAAPQPTPEVSTPLQEPNPNTIQLKQGEDIVLSPDSAPTTRVTPTPEEVAALQQKMGPRPEKQSTQPAEEVANGQEVQAETQVKPIENITQPVSQETPTQNEISTPVAGEATMEEFEAARKQFQNNQSKTPFKQWFGDGTPGVTATKEGTPLTLYHGTNNPLFTQWDSTRSAEASGHPTSGLGFFMTADKGAAARYGSNLLELHAKINNPYTLTDADLTSIETPADAARMRESLIKKGYDGAVVEAPGASPYVIAFEPNQIKLTSNENPTSSPDMRFSQPAQQATTRVTPENIRSNIDSALGKDWLQQAEQHGLVEVVDGAGPNGEAGSWSDGKIRLYTDSMPANGSPLGVLLHEGKHASFESVLGDSLPSYVKDLHTLAESGNKVAQDAISHAAIASAEILGIKHNLLENGTKTDLANLRSLIEERHPGLLAEEELAYFVQHGADAQGGTGFLRRLLNQIKAWFAQTQLGQRMKELGLGFEMTDGMAVEWAKMGLNKSLEKLGQAEQTKSQVEQQAANMPPSVRLGRALEGLNTENPLYSMSIQEIKNQLWTDPTDIRQELVNKPGLLQKWRADFVDFFSMIEKKSKDIYDTYSLLRSKKAARIEQARQEYFMPLRKLIAESPWTAKEFGDMMAARHIKIDRVNTVLAERASDIYAEELLKVLPKVQRTELTEARTNVENGKMPDGKEYTDAAGKPIEMSALTKHKLMFDLMNKYAPQEIIDAEGRQALREEWELFKDAAGGFSDGGVGKGKVRTVDEVLQLANKDQAKFDKIAAIFDAANRHTLDILEDGKLITAAEHARLLADKSAYAPLRRESYNVDNETARMFQRAGQGGSKQITTRAGTENLSEPTLVLQNALASMETAAAAAERNLANTELYKAIVANKAEWKPWFTISDGDKYATHDASGFLVERHSTSTSPADIVLIHNGKKMVISPNMHNDRALGFVRAVNNLDAQNLSGPMKAIGWANQLVRAVNVSFSPIFLMRNAIMDPFTAAYNMQASEAAKYAGEIFSNYGRAFKALKKVFLDGNRDPNDLDVQWVEKWENAGGRASFIDSLKSMDDTWKGFDAQVARRQGNFKALMKAKDKWIDGIENFNLLFENVMRFSTFQTLVENKVVSEQKAARISQDLTTNFTRRGYKTQMLGTWWLFFNASVQGNYQVARNLMTSHRVQAMAGGTVAMAVMLDLMGRALYPDDWDKIPENDKERFIVTPVKIGGDFVKIPAPWVYNSLWRAGSMMGEVIAGKRKVQDFAIDLAALISTTFSPLGKPGSLAQAISPTAADPFIQILENKDFAGNPIGPEGFPGASKRANSELLWSSTPRGYQSFARFVNEATGGSATESGKIDLRPGDYQILARFITGSLGRFLSDSTFGFSKTLDKGIEGPKDIPVIKELFSDPYDPISVQKYHTNIANVYGAHRLEQMYMKGPDKDLIKLQEVRQERGNELQLYAQAQDVERQLKSIRVRLRAAQNREDATTEKELKDKMSKIQERFNTAYQQRVE